MKSSVARQLSAGLTLLTAMTTANVQSQASSCVPPPSGLVGWWKGDGNTMDVVSGNYGVLVNAGYTNGIVEQAFSFDPENYPVGTYNAVQIADQPAYALTNSLTIEAWVRPRGDGYAVFWRGDNHPGYANPYILGMLGNNILEFQITDAGNNSAEITTPLNYFVWTHVAATLDGASGTMSIYTNGVLAAQAITAIRPFGPLIPTDSPGIGIGNVNDGYNNFPFHGDIDEVSLYSRALTVAEIQAIFNAGSEGKCADSSPTIISSPGSVDAALYSSNVLSVSASGTPPLAYQWAFNGTNIIGANGSTYILSSFDVPNIGNYAAIVSNPYGSVTSAVASVQMIPSLSSPFGGALALWGQPATLNVGAVGSGTLNYQWYFNGVAIPGANGSSYSFDSIQFTNAGLYSVVVSSDYGSVTNTAYQVVVNPAYVSLKLCANVVIQGTVGYIYTIQSTMDLSNTNSWIVETNLTLSQPIEYWDDTSVDVHTGPQKFYRVLPGQ